MAQTLRVALIGFSTFERTTLDTLFRLTAQRKLHYTCGGPPAKADVVLVDVDQAAAAAEALPWATKCVAIGAASLPGQAGRMARPINAMVLLKQLDAVVAQRPAAAVAAVLPPAQEIEPHRPSLDSALEPARIDNILVVHDSDTALRFLTNRLGRFGYDVQLVKSGEQALQRVAEQHFEFVFLDAALPGIDGYQTCKLIKRRAYPRGHSAPAVVLLTNRSTMVDKLRCALAGFDGCLTKPLQDDALIQLLGDRFVEHPCEATTARVPLAQF